MADGNNLEGLDLAAQRCHLTIVLDMLVASVRYSHNGTSSLRRVARVQCYTIPDIISPLALLCHAFMWYPDKMMLSQTLNTPAKKRRMPSPSTLVPKPRFERLPCYYMYCSRWRQSRHHESLSCPTSAVHSLQTFLPHPPRHCLAQI